eukprot:1321229-Amorphochlora_amoeboformis.AAC.1
MVACTSAYVQYNIFLKWWMIYVHIEYLWTEEEKAKWLMEDPEDRPYNFLPNKFDSLREVP